MTGLTKLFDGDYIRYEINLLGCTMMYKSGRLIFYYIFIATKVLTNVYHYDIVYVAKTR